MPKSWGFIKDPIHGYVRVNPVERTIVDTRPVQRLRRLRQLAGSEYVYPAANHTRFEHVIGAMHLAGELSETLPVNMDPHDQEQMRLAALVHDIGHGPFSHVFEPLMVRHLKKTHEDLVPWLVSETEIAERLDKAGFNPKKVGLLAVGRLGDKKRPYLDQIISSSVDVDKMDFLVRDSFHTGAGYGAVDVHRLLYTMDVMNGNLAVDGRAVATLESFLLARLESFRTIYFHRASRAVQIMIVRALEAAKDELGLLGFDKPDDYLRLDDYKVWTDLKQSKKSRRIMQDLEARRLLKCAYEKTVFAPEELVSNVMTKDSVRQDIESEIAKKARVSTEDVIIDVPTLPSVPYHNAVEIQPLDIPVFRRGPTGRKEIVQLSDISRIIGVLRTFMNLVRVYTRDQYRVKIETASRQVLGETGSITRASV
ncbi:MAG TPA: HD domain-containing protein [Candidatus Bathyarchaeia archaeon]|nr:HD domain-containing protein [Candidatus Bathyarchaeia archaeon]